MEARLRFTGWPDTEDWPSSTSSYMSISRTQTGGRGEQVMGWNTESRSQLRNSSERCVALAALDRADVSAIQIGEFGQLFLRPTFVATQAAHIGAE